MLAVKTQNLSVRFGQVWALDQVDLELSAGRIIGLIGPSGAGKTTLIQAIVGRLKLPKSAVTVLGKQAGSPQLRQKIAYMTQSLSVYGDLTVEENMVYFGRMNGLRSRELHAAIREMLETVDLTKKADTLTNKLSRGQQQRVSLAVTLLGKPELLVLDEPTTGLDPALRNRLWRIFRQLSKEGTTLIISSHSMDEASRCDDLVLIREGRIIAHDTPEELLARTKANSVEQAFLQLAGGES